MDEFSLFNYYKMLVVDFQGFIMYVVVISNLATVFVIKQHNFFHFLCLPDIILTSSLHHPDISLKQAKRKPKRKKYYN